MIVNPAEGALVRDPMSKLALEAGAEVDDHDPYFARLLADGDLIAVLTEPAPAAPVATRRSAVSSEDAA